MTLLLTLLLVLWGSPQAGAEESTGWIVPAEFSVPDTWVPVCGEKPPGGAYYLPCAVDVLIKKGWLEERHIAWLERAQDVSKDPCLDKMKMAMQAMDKSIPQFFRKMILSGRTYWEFTNQDGGSFTMTEAQAKAYWEMLDQWELAKACWQKETP